MLLLRVILAAVLLFNSLVADMPADAIVASCQDAVVLPTSTFAVLLGYSMPLDMVSHFIEETYPVSGKSSNHKKDNRKHQPVSDICVLLPQNLVSSSNLRASPQNKAKSIAAVAAGSAVNYLCFPCKIVSYYRRSIAAGDQILSYLVILSLKNLPGDITTLISINTVKDPSGNRGVFSLGEMLP